MRGKKTVKRHAYEVDVLWEGSKITRVTGIGLPENPCVHGLINVYVNPDGEVIMPPDGAKLEDIAEDFEAYDKILIIDVASPQAVPKPKPFPWKWKDVRFTMGRTPLVAGYIESFGLAPAKTGYVHHYNIWELLPDEKDALFGKIAKCLVENGYYQFSTDLSVYLKN